MTALDALNLAAPLADTYSAVEQRLLVAVARQLTLNDNHALNEVSKWQIKQLAFGRSIPLRISGLLKCAEISLR